MTMRASFIAGASAGALLTTTILAGSTASATPPSTPGPAPDGLVLVSQLDGRAKAKADGIDFRIKHDVVVRNFVLRYPADSNSGWHAHPGIVMASVISGSVTRYLPCGGPDGQTFTVGDAFVEVGPHYVESELGAALAITQIAPKGTGSLDKPFREDIETAPALIC